MLFKIHTFKWRKSEQNFNWYATFPKKYALKIKTDIDDLEFPVGSFWSWDDYTRT